MTLLIAFLMVFFSVHLPLLFWIARWQERREQRLRRENLERELLRACAPGCVYVTEEVD